ncbi:MAG: MmpS family transport accessory protein [Segniliparus sp.]|uniref:MmpS family transport accessory protein n=1 Tax=Segniliparus sp. TaxID=2804064 RepID=UPI003F3F6EB6
MSVSRTRRLFKLAWLPALCLVVVSVAALIMVRAHGIFGSKDETGTLDKKFAIVEFNPKKITYEVFGDFRQWGRIDYWDKDTKSVDVQITSLPWTHTETIVVPVGTGDITAQTDGGFIGCRISVNGEVRDEHTTSGEHAGVFCQVLSA